MCYHDYGGGEKASGNLRVEVLTINASYSKINLRVEVLAINASYSKISIEAQPWHLLCPYDLQCPSSPFPWFTESPDSVMRSRA